MFTEQLSPAEGARLARYAEYRAFYNGDQWLGPARPGERRLVFNYGRAFVNKAASYLMGEPVRLRVRGQGAGAGAAAAERAAEDWLAEVAAFNHLPLVDLETAISAGTLGDGAWRVGWDEAARLPRVTGIDPANLRCAWRGDDFHTLTWLEHTYPRAVEELTAAQRGGLAGRYDAGERVRVMERWTAERWELWVENTLVEVGLNPYGRIPYVVFPNLRVPGAFWGESDLVDLLAIGRDLNARLSVLSRILEVSGNPIAVVENVGETSGLRVGPGQLWELPEGARAYLLDLLSGGGVQLHVEYVNLVYRAMHDVAEMPRTSFGDVGGQGARSGVALQIELQPLLHKLARKRLTWGVALEERAGLLLAVAAVNNIRFSPAPLALRPYIEWPAVLPQDRTELVGQETTLVQHGIHSHQRAMTALGEADPAALWAEVQSEGLKFEV